MTERDMGSSFQWFFGKVVNRKDDPTKSGKIQVRIYGIHDNESDIPDTDLPWAYPMMPITSASFEHVGQSPTGVTEGATVFGFFVDHEKQIPVVMGTIHRPALPDPNGESTGTTVNP